MQYKRFLKDIRFDLSDHLVLIKYNLANTLNVYSEKPSHFKDQSD